MFLNDWGCAAQIKKRVAFEGALEFAHDEILKSLSPSYAPKASHDLVMFVKCFYSSIFPAHTLNLFKEEKHILHYLNFWTTHLNTPFWTNFLKQAENEEYENMISSIQYIIN